MFFKWKSGEVRQMSGAVPGTLHSWWQARLVWFQTFPLSIEYGSLVGGTPFWGWISVHPDAGTWILRRPRALHRAGSSMSLFRHIGNDFETLTGAFKSHQAGGVGSVGGPVTNRFVSIHNVLEHKRFWKSCIRIGYQLKMLVSWQNVVESSRKHEVSLKNATNWRKPLQKANLASPKSVFVFVNFADDRPIPGDFHEINCGRPTNSIC